LGAANRFNTPVGLIVALSLCLFNLSWYYSARLLFQSRRVSLSQDSYRRILSDSLLRHELQTTPNPFPRQDRVCIFCVLSQISCPFLPFTSLPRCSVSVNLFLQGDLRFLKQDRGYTCNITLRCAWIFAFWTVLRWQYSLIDRMCVCVCVCVHKHTHRDIQIFQKSKNRFIVLGARMVA